MGRIKFGKFQQRSDAQSVRLEFDGAADMDVARQRIRRLSRVLQKGNENCCYVLGDGGLPKGTYGKFSDIGGIDVVESSGLLPFYLFFLDSIIASESGLVKVVDFSKLPMVFDALTEQSMAIIFLMGRKNEKSFLENYKGRKRSSLFDCGVRGFDEHFVYLFDADNAESASGMAEYCSCGSLCDESIVEIFSVDP